VHKRHPFVRFQTFIMTPNQRVKSMNTTRHIDSCIFKRTFLGLIVCALTALPVEAQPITVTLDISAEDDYAVYLVSGSTVSWVTPPSTWVPGVHTAPPIESWTIPANFGDDVLVSVRNVNANPAPFGGMMVASATMGSMVAETGISNLWTSSNQGGPSNLTPPYATNDAFLLGVINGFWGAPAIGAMAGSAPGWPGGGSDPTSSLAPAQFIWAQPGGSTGWGFSGYTSPQTAFFRLNVIPEPASALLLLLPAAVASGLYRCKRSERKGDSAVHTTNRLDSSDCCPPAGSVEAKTFTFHTYKFTSGLFTVALILGILSGRAAASTVYGLKSATGGSSNFSTTPTRLFSFQMAGSGFVTDIGTVTLGPAQGQIDADGLAMSAIYGLRAFELQKIGTTVTGSKLIDIDPNTAVATDSVTQVFPPIPRQPIMGRNIRGAAFDASNRLWALDSSMNELLEFDPLSGVPINSAPLTLLGIPFDLSSTTDLAIDTNGTFHMTDLSSIYTVNTLGVMNLIYTVPPAGTPSLAQSLIGAVFDVGPPGLFALEATGTDDVQRYPIPGFAPRTTPYLNIIPNISGIAFNAGGGDLAAIVPEPATMALLNLGLFTMLVRRRRTRLCVRCAI
jgi:hypothetical protein